VGLRVATAILLPSLCSVGPSRLAAQPGDAQTVTGDPAELRALVADLDSRDLGLRCRAALALGALGPDHRPRILARLHRETEAQVECFFEALGAAGGVPDDGVAALLRHRNDSIRSAMAWRLVGQSPSAAMAQADVLGSARAALERTAAVDVLSALCHRSWPAPDPSLRERMQQAIVAALHDRAPGPRGRALKLFGECGCVELNALRASYLPRLLKMAKTSGPEQVPAILAVGCRAEPAAAIAAVATLARHSRPGVREAVISAAGSVLSNLSLAREEGSRRGYALAELKPADEAHLAARGVAVLLDGLRDGDLRTRSTACHYLGAAARYGLLGDAEDRVRTALQKLLGAKEASLRDGAAAALAELERGPRRPRP
jgi:hypothetical protein